ncbi:MAG: carbohydrate ABC transporter permease [Clostridia bacterium]|nr:carbohydrate ABC transporter permease [Clostridia bacterium]
MSHVNGRSFSALRTLTIVILSIIMGFPLLLTLSVSLQTMPQIYASSPILWPGKLQFGNYSAAMQNGDWPRYLANSAYVTALTVLTSLFINGAAGYTIARIPFRGRKPVFALILVGMMIPPQVTMIPVFTMLRGVPFAGGNDAFGHGGLGLLNTYAGLVAPYVAGSFGVFLCRQYYLTFPSALDDAARIDGAGRVRIFYSLYIPLSGPLFATLGVLKFTGAWNEYTWPLVMTHSDSMKTVQLALTMFRDEAEIRWNELMAATLVSSAAIYAVFLFAQKYFISGMLAGSVKG